MGGVKDKRKDEQKAEVVHETECKGCEKTYIGEMARNANIRAKEHLFSCDQWAVRSVSGGRTCVDGAGNRLGANRYHDR